MIALRALVTFAGLVVLWQALVMLTGMPHYLLPAPSRVAETLWARADILWEHARITVLEIALGLLLGVLSGAFCALVLMASRLARQSDESPDFHALLMGAFDHKSRAAET